MKMENTEVLIAPPITIINSPIPVAILAPIELKPPSTCPWGQIKATEAVSLNDVMSEELVKTLVQEKKSTNLVDSPVLVDDFVGCGEDVTDCSDDFLLAKMLQLEFDKEHDDVLQKEESKYNSSSKVKLSYEKYRRLPKEDFSFDEEDADYTIEQSEKKHWENFDQAKKDFKAVGRSGVSRQGNVTTTKHDPVICGRKNAEKVMKISTTLPTGDGGIFDMKLSNHVYNALRAHSIHEEKLAHKILQEKKDKSTTEKAMDEKTHLILYKMVNNQTLDSLTGCISTGKEACVYHAWSGTSEDDSPSVEYAIKVYKTTLNEFQNRDEYIKNDYRFRNRFKNQNPRKVIHMWAEKEMRNLLRLKEAEIPCPDVVILKKHVLVMSFIGENMLPAPKVKDVELPFEEMTIMYEQTVEIMKNLYSKCKMVHADLSEYNLLWHKGKTWVIDVSQSIEIIHPGAHDFLFRDCTNISSFFQKRGVLCVPSPKDLFFEVCGKDYLPNQALFRKQPSQELTLE